MNNYPYRKGANAFVLDKNNLFLLVQKQTYDKNQWDIPGGGIDNDENPESCILRELKEELGSTDFKIIKKSPFNDKYEWPKKAQEHGFTKYGKWWKGQEKYQFIVRFTGKKNSLILQETEIRKIKWVAYSELKKHLIFNGQWENAKKVLENFGII